MSTGAKLGIGCLGITAVLAIGGVGCMAVVASTASDPDETVDAADADTGDEAEETEEDTGTTVGNGIHLVDDDIPAGTYQTDGPDEDDILPMCYWARLSGTSGELEEIIANDNLEGPGVVTIEESDVALELSGGCDWTLDE
ncbi:hypothetical protein J4H86_09500 [Spiractinospora alimapuensis]|nr:hypothetical protein J4H86_09500 [Spiractinospora alimapuensis]